MFTQIYIIRIKEDDIKTNSLDYIIKSWNKSKSFNQHIEMVGKFLYQILEVERHFG